MVSSGVHIPTKQSSALQMDGQGSQQGVAELGLGGGVLSDDFVPSPAYQRPCGWEIDFGRVKGSRLV